MGLCTHSLTILTKQSGFWNLFLMLIRIGLNILEERLGKLFYFILLSREEYVRKIQDASDPSVVLAILFETTLVYQHIGP